MENSIQPWIPTGRRLTQKELPVLNPKGKNNLVVCLFKMAHFDGASSARTEDFADGVCKNIARRQGRPHKHEEQKPTLT
jgi:hypothetical protein